MIYWDGSTCRISSKRFIQMEDGCQDWVNTRVVYIQETQGKTYILMKRDGKQWSTNAPIQYCKHISNSWANGIILDQSKPIYPMDEQLNIPENSCLFTFYSQVSKG